MARDIEAGRAYVKISIRENLRGLKNISRKLKVWGATMSSMGTRMAGLGIAMGAPFAFAVKTFADFDDAMRTLRAVTQGTVSDIGALTSQAKLLGATTSFTAIQVGELMVVLGRANFKPDEIKEMTGAVLDMARATGTDAALAAGVMSATLRQFGLEASQATRVADLFTVTANGSFNTVEQLGQAMEYVGPVAKELGMSLEDTLAILGGLGNLGIQSSMAGTALKRISLAAAAEAEKMERIFGVSFVDAAGNALPLVDVLDRVRQSLQGLGTAERAKKMNEAFGLRGITGAGGIGANAASIRELRDALDDSAGAAAKAAAMMDSGLGGALRILNSAIEGVKIAIGEALEGVLIRMGTNFTDAAGSVREFIEANKEVVVLIAAVTAGVIAGGIALAVIGVSFSIAGAIMTPFIAAISMAGSALAFLLTPVGAIAALIAVLTTGMVLATVAFVKFTDIGQLAADLIGGVLASAFRTLWDSLSRVAGLIAGDVVTAFGTLRETLRGVSDALSSGDMEGAVRVAMLGLEIAFRESTDSISELWAAWNKGIVDMLAETLKTVVRLGRMLPGTIAVEWASGVDLTDAISDFQSLMRDNFDGTLRDSRAEVIRLKEELATLLLGKGGGAGQAGLASFGIAMSAMMASIAAEQAKAESAGGGSGQSGLAVFGVGMAAMIGSMVAEQAGAVKDAISLAPALTGTFSAMAAKVGFAGIKGDDLAKQTAKNTEETTKILGRIERKGGTSPVFA